MRISVILSTYNQPQWLEKSLWGYAQQTERPLEILVADDGSGPETREVIAAARRASGLNLRHVWHEDDGFRKTVILNKALAEARGDYLVFSDGDAIPRADYLATHRRCARPGWFLSGGLVRLPLSVSRLVTRNDVQSGRCFCAQWVREHTAADEPRPKLLKLTARGAAAEALNRLTPTRATWNGCNASCWREDALRVRGFDERMQYGGEDREFGERLRNLGLRSAQLRYTAICVHLEHGRGYVRPEMWERNRRIRAETRAARRTATDFGLPPAA